MSVVATIIDQLQTLERERDQAQALLGEVMATFRIPSNRAKIAAGTHGPSLLAIVDGWRQRYDALGAPGNGGDARALAILEALLAEARHLPPGQRSDDPRDWLKSALALIRSAALPALPERPVTSAVRRVWHRRHASAAEPR